jgi:hypothetical protein
MGVWTDVSFFFAILRNVARCLKMLKSINEIRDVNKT